MRRYVLKRVLLGILTLIGVSIIIFVAIRLSGDVTLLLVSPDATQEEIQKVRVELGLDKSLPVQYLVFAKNVLRGDFGRSTRYRQPAMEIVLGRLPATIQLAGVAFLISVGSGLLLGVISATKRNSLLDAASKVFATLGQAMPEFWIGIMAILVFSVHWGLLPTSGRGRFVHLIMPAFTLGWYSTASIMRLTRSGMLGVLDSEYIKTARLKGNPERVVVWKHALRNALIPVVAMGGIQLGRLLGGAVIVESIFGWPGVGQLVLDAVYSRDYALVQAGVFITSAFFIFLNLTVDLAFGLIDPRIRYE